MKEEPLCSLFQCVCLIKENKLEEIGRRGRRGSKRAKIRIKHERNSYNK